MISNFKPSASAEASGRSMEPVNGGDLSSPSPEVTLIDAMAAVAEWPTLPAGFADCDWDGLS